MPADSTPSPGRTLEVVGTLFNRRPPRPSPRTTPSSPVRTIRAPAAPSAGGGAGTESAPGAQGGGGRKNPGRENGAPPASRRRLRGEDQDAGHQHRDEARRAPPAARADHFALGSGESHFLGAGRWALGAG